MPPAQTQAEAPLPRYNQPYQGLLRCHALNATGSNLVKGGGYVLLWKFYQTRDPDILANRTDSFDDAAIDAVINTIKEYYAGGKKTYLFFAMFSSGDTQGLPAWTNPNTSSQKFLFINTSGTYPSPWDSNYRRLLKEYLEHWSQKIEQAGASEMVEYIEPSVGGIWGSTHLWTSTLEQLEYWISAAGCPRSDQTCLGQKFGEAVNAITSIYSDAFPKIPIMIIGGGCRSDACQYKKLPELLDKYGMKIMYKEAGIGHPYQPSCGLKGERTGPVCGNGDLDNGRMTRCGQEPWGPSVNCGGYGFDPTIDETRTCGQNYEQIYKNSLLGEKISYYCMYSQELTCADSMVNSTNQFVADHLGSQIRLVSPSFSALDANVGSNVTLNTTWENTGSVSLIVPLKQGTKWTPVSYKLLLEFEKDNILVHHELLDINPPTGKWWPVRNFFSVSIPFSVPISSALGGETDNSEQTYKVYASLTDPNGENKRFVLINTEAANDKIRRRYLLTDSLVVRGKGSPATPTPSPTGEITPSPEPSGSPTPTPQESAITLNFRFQQINSQKPDQKVTFLFKKETETIREFADISVSNNNQGTFSATLTNIPEDTYDIYIKGWAHLRKKFSGISTESGGDNTLDLTSAPMIAGDFTGNNVLDIEDLSDMISKFTDVSVPVNDNIRKYDVNLSDTLDIEDLSLVISNFTDVSVNGD